MLVLQTRADNSSLYGTDSEENLGLRSKHGQWGMLHSTVAGHNPQQVGHYSLGISLAES